MSNNFCRYLSNGYSFSINRSQNSVKVKPCCLFKQSYELNADLQENRKRYDQIQDWVPECERCQIVESSGQQSLRQASFEWIPLTDHNHPMSIDVYLDNFCNAACVICGEQSSSLWHKEKQKLINQSFQIKLDIDTVDSKITEISSAFDYRYLRYIKFFGGEPLFTDSHLKFLKTIPDPKNITVHYTTNGSIFPSQETLAVWDRFKTIIFSASLDGTEQQFDYVRWPLPWAKVSANLLQLKAQKIHNVMFRVEFTVNFLNAWYFDRLHSWVKHNWNTNEFGDYTEINVHHCEGIFDLKRMPINLQQEILTKYPAGHIIHNMVANIGKPHSLDPFNEFTATWDQKRKQYWRQSFKEIANFFPNQT